MQSKRSELRLLFSSANHMLPIFLACISSSFIIASATPAPKPAEAARVLNAAQLTKILDSSGILQKGYRCSVVMDNSTATVTSYQNLASKNPDNDCKIDAVLLSKKVFDSCPSLARVKVKLLDPRGSGNHKTITITVGDISAYSAGKITMESLMNSLEIVNGSDKPNNESASNKVYSVTKASFIINYPSNWDLKEHPDAQTEACMGGLNADGKIAELRICVTDAPQAMTAEQFGQNMSSMFAHSLKAYKKIEESPEAFGKHRELNGLSVLSSFEMNKVTVIQQCTFFTCRGRLCWLTITCPGWNPHDAKALANGFLASIEAR